ncbi:MAG: hypothetical protein ACREQT_06045 [Candidatus Binataceae bacterium]
MGFAISPVAAAGELSALGAAIDAAAAGEEVSAGACAKAGIAIAPANSAAVNIETVRFISFSFFWRFCMNL